MTSYTTSERWRVPYRLGTDDYCIYGNENNYVHMGDMVTVCYETYAGEDECSGELRYVRYGWDGFIDSVALFQSKDSVEVEVMCDGTFYRMEVADDD